MFIWRYCFNFIEQKLPSNVQQHNWTIYVLTTCDCDNKRIFFQLFIFVVVSVFFRPLHFDRKSYTNVPFMCAPVFFHHKIQSIPIGFRCTIVTFISFFRNPNYYRRELSTKQFTVYKLEWTILGLYWRIILPCVVSFTFEVI